MHGTMAPCAVRRALIGTLLAAGGMSSLDAVRADPPPYRLAGSTTGPGGMFDILNDGRIVAVVGDDLVIETAPRSSVYELAGSFAPGTMDEFGAAFISVSPDGGRLAIGDGRSENSFVHVVHLGDLNGGPVDPVSYSHRGFDASWLDENQLAVSWSDPNDFNGRVSALDFSTSQSHLLVTVEGASAGVAIDRHGNVLTGNGFDFSGPATGEIRAFGHDAIQDIIHGLRDPLMFTADGALVGEVLSAGSLRFDEFGHLFAGGGDFAEPDFEYFGILDGLAVEAAILGGDPVDFDDIFTDDPDPIEFSFYTGRYNGVTDEWLVMTFGDSTLYRYEYIPAPVGAALVLIGVGTIAGRRRGRG